MKKIILKIFIILLIPILWVSCAKKKQSELPFLGFHEINTQDTIYYQIPKFSFRNQDSVVIDNKHLSNHIYVADFFYTYCPTICPRVKSQMLRIYDKYKNEDKVKLVSFALDPKRDDVDHLNLYAKNLGVASNKWYFLTGDKEKIWDLAGQFLISVRADKDEPGGIFHSGKIMLIDPNGHIRGFAEGTLEEKVTILMEEIDLLITEISPD